MLITPPDHLLTLSDAVCLGFSWDEAGARDYLSSSELSSRWVWTDPRPWPSAGHDADMLQIYPKLNEHWLFQSAELHHLQRVSQLSLDQGRLAGSLSRHDYEPLIGEAIASLIAPRPLPLALRVPDALFQTLMSAPLSKQERSLPKDHLLLSRAQKALGADPIQDFADFKLPVADLEQWAAGAGKLVEERVALFSARAEARALNNAAPATLASSVARSRVGL